MNSKHRMLFAILPPAVAAGVGSIGARSAKPVYARLRKPPWAPPAAAFGPVWSVLYILIGAAGWRVAGSTRQAKVLHFVQLGCNAMWPITFFTMRNRRAAVVVVALLDAALVGEIGILWRRDRRAAALLLPYLAWSGFATMLNLAVTDEQESDVDHGSAALRSPQSR